ncbi:alpha/beta-hydrolase [Aspergillus ruber CBS 135680]|uniref:Alpha/beta-hydrolase n=1 Tax=Aspergillus ruber (strain CBS 135680) TaxID=1388766 RepID=A0A017RZ52_ASPRC|nr:alpha/beta-hydrolase [Aspergillus ruber CBS 135680]EYE89952.1 alpha/beta-hydrolase [Aspergillus ruber CBS 135680]
MARFPDLPYKPLTHPSSHPVFKYNGFHPNKTHILPKGHVRESGYQASPVDVIWEQDTSIRMRDDVKLYADIFRPATTNGAEKVPAIIPWSPYGKVGTGSQTYDNMGPWRMGIPFQVLSGYETFEGPNPLEWCGRGYAVVDADARGAGNSEGDMAFWGEQEAIDIYDTITWIAAQPWCNGSIVMMGNSWLAISQINFASRFTHPNLKAIAPWEALTDPYDHSLCRGGVPSAHFFQMILGGFAGSGRAEDLGSMISKRPLFDEFWESKRIFPERIRNVPMYLTASYSTGLHCEGSFETFQRARTPKWLRVHNTQEWRDIYKPEVLDDLQRFYDFYAKGIQNGWETDTPRVRLSLLGYENSPAKTVVERPEEEWPPARQMTRKYYLDASTRSMSTSNPERVSSISHEGHSLTASSDFTFYFSEYTELCGRPYAKLYMSCPDNKDFDISIQLRKLSSTGEPLESLNWTPMPKPAPEVPNVNVAKHLGQQGMLRASHHVSLLPPEDGDEDGFPHYDHKSRQDIVPGDIVPFLVPIWPVGMVFEAGEGLMLRVSGHDMILPEVEIMRLREPVDENVGMQVVHTGGEYASFLVLPVI